MTATPPIQLSNVDATLLPPTIADAIFTKSIEMSALMSLGRKVPLAMTANTEIPIPGDVPIADWVNEVGRKPLGGGTIGFKTMKGKKLAVLVPVSAEVARTNPVGLYDQLERDLPTALARAFDFAGIHGRSLRTGGAGPFTDWLTKTAQSVTLGTQTQSKGGLWADLVTGEQLVTDADWDFNGILADKRLKPTLKLQTDVNGRPIFLEDRSLGSYNAGDGVGSMPALQGDLIGYPAAFSSAVSGKFRRQSTSSDSGLRAVGGDFSQVAFGVGMEIEIKVSNEATYVDEDGGVHSAFQENLVLLLAEAYYGLVIAGGQEQGDADDGSTIGAFVKYVNNAGVTS